jgi:membrane protease YdiL (CAAX protease family)
MAISSTDRKYVGPSRRAFYTTLVFVFLSMVPGLLIPAAKVFAYIPPIVYIFRERRINGRSWEEIGIKLRGFKKDFLTNWHLILIVAVVLQLPIALIGKFYWPDLLKHISDRIPFLNSSPIAYLILIIIVIPFFEELIYRGLLQQRLRWYLNGFVAIIIASVVFGLQHFTPGQLAIVAVDVAGVAIDGIFFGLIFARCHNVFVSWTAHVAADLVGLVVLMLLV